MKTHYPLLVIDAEGDCTRFFVSSSGERKLEPLRCPFKDCFCSSNCVVFGSAEIKKNLFFVCRVRQPAIILGLVDFDTTSIDRIESLQTGNDLLESFRNEKK